MRNMQVVLDCNTKFLRIYLIILVFLYQAWQENRFSWHKSFELVVGKIREWHFLSKAVQTKPWEVVILKFPTAIFTLIITDHVNPHIRFIAADCFVIFSYYFTTDITQIARTQTDIKCKVAYWIFSCWNVRFSVSSLYIKTE